MSKEPREPVQREHVINTHWQALIDRVFVMDSGDYVKELDLALEILQAVHLPIAWEMLRVSSMKVSDTIVRIAEEREAKNG